MGIKISFGKQYHLQQHPRKKESQAGREAVALEEQCHSKACMCKLELPVPRNVTMLGNGVFERLLNSNEAIKIGFNPIKLVYTPQKRRLGHPDRHLGCALRAKALRAQGQGALCEPQRAVSEEARPADTLTTDFQSADP